MGQDLNCRIGAVVAGRHAELSADVISSRGCIVSSKNNVSEIPALLGYVQNEIGGLEICLRDSKVENSLSCRQVDWDCSVDTSLAGCGSSKH